MKSDRKRLNPDEVRDDESAEDRSESEATDGAIAPVSGGGMSGTGAPTHSRSHSGTSTTPGAGPNPDPGGAPAEHSSLRR